MKCFRTHYAFKTHSLLSSFSWVAPGTSINDASFKGQSRAFARVHAELVYILFAHTLLMDTTNRMET
jgi:hypothetical protein